MRLIPGLLSLEIIRVYLAPYKVKAQIIGSYAAAPAPKVSIKDFVTGLCVSLQKPRIQGHGLLCGVYAVLLVAHILLQHAVPFIFEYPGGGIKA